MPAGGSPRGKRSIPKTFRLPADLIEKLEAHAEAEGTSTNSLVFTLLNRYVEWEAQARKLGLVWVSPAMIRVLLASADDEKLARFGRTDLQKWWSELAIILYGDDSPESLVKVATEQTRYSWISASSFTKSGPTHRWNLSHNMGPKFSLLIGSAIDELLWTTIHTRPKVKMGDSLVSVTFDHRESDWVP